MTSVGQPSGEDANPDSVDVLVIGAGITGTYQLYCAREAGFSTKLVEAGGGVGGTWYWNRYPGARFDSESYTYAYIFSKELFDDWEWSEHFASQPEIERYMNHVIDRFDLRRDMYFNARVNAAVWDESSATWTVRTDDGREYCATFVVAAAGVLSVPYFPEVPGREEFRGESHHTGLWPAEGVNVRGKRVAVIGTGSSGVQIVPEIADEVASLTVFQRSPHWATPLNNGPITSEEQIQLRADFEQIRQILLTSPSGLLHARANRAAADETPAERRAFYEQMWASPGFAKLSSNYSDLATNRTANAEWCAFIADRIRDLVDDPAVAERLIPTDHRYGEKRPPFVTDYYQAYNKPTVSLVDLRDTPIVRVVETGIETTEGLSEFDVIVWATGFDFGTGALNRMGVKGVGGTALEDAWADGPRTFLGLQTVGFPNFFFPGGPHAAAANNPRYNGDQVDFIIKLLLFARQHQCDRIEVDPAAEAEWTDMVDTVAKSSPHTEISYFFGSNIPGKPRKFLINPSGRPSLHQKIAEVIDNDFGSFIRLPQAGGDEPASRANLPADD